MLQASRVRREASHSQLVSYFATTSRLPKLLVTGLQDRICPPSTVINLAEQLGDQAQTCELPNCGHLSHEEASRELLTKLTSFVCEIL